MNDKEWTIINGWVVVSADEFRNLLSMRVHFMLTEFAYFIRLAFSGHHLCRLRKTRSASIVLRCGKWDWPFLVAFELVIDRAATDMIRI